MTTVEAMPTRQPIIAAMIGTIEEEEDY